MKFVLVYPYWIQKKSTKSITGKRVFIGYGLIHKRRIQNYCFYQQNLNSSFRKHPKVRKILKKIESINYHYKQTTKRVLRKGPKASRHLYWNHYGIIKRKQKSFAVRSVVVKKYGFSKSVRNACFIYCNQLLDMVKKMACTILRWSQEAYR